jgi:hypothetical protein
MLLNISLQKLIQPLWRPLDFLSGKYMTMWWNDMKYILCCLTLPASYIMHDDLGVSNL